MEIFLFIKGILVKDEIFNFVFSDFNNTPNLRLKFIDDSCSVGPYSLWLKPRKYFSPLKSIKY